MKQQEMVFNLEEERRQRVIAFMINPSNAKAFTSLGWKFPRVLKVAKRAVALGMDKERRYGQ